MEKFMSVEAINLKRIWEWIDNVWAKSLAAFIMFFIGLYMGQVQTESRVVGDCKYAGAFRVEQQAFACQRRI